MIDLRQLIEFGSRTAEQIFRRQGYFVPMWHAILPDGHHKVIPQTVDDKDMQLALVRSAFEIFNAQAYVFISEAWTLYAETRNEAEREIKIKQYQREGIRGNPDRVEVLWLQAEDQTGLLSARRKIIRPGKGNPTLGPLEFEEMQSWTIQGRIIGLLPRPPRTQVQ